MRRYKLMRGSRPHEIADLTSCVHCMDKRTLMNIEDANMLILRPSSSGQHAADMRIPCQCFDRRFVLMKPP